MGAKAREVESEKLRERPSNSTSIRPPPSPLSLSVLTCFMRTQRLMLV